MRAVLARADVSAVVAIETGVAFLITCTAIISGIAVTTSGNDIRGIRLVGDACQLVGTV